MTLALYGKSRRRKGALLTAALLAVIIATVGALGAITSAFAHKATVTGKAECTADGWKVTWTIKGDTASKRMHIDSFSVTDSSGVTAGTTSAPSPDPVPEGSNPQQATAQTTGIPSSTTSVTATAKIYWDKADGSGRYPASGTKEYKVSVAKPDCATIIIKKVVTDEGHSTEEFKADVVNTGGGGSHRSGEKAGLVFSQSKPYVHSWDEDSPDDTFEVTEQDPGSKWSTWYWSGSGDAACPSADSKDWKFGRTASLGVVKNGDTKTVCFLNEYKSGNIQVHKYLPKSNPNDNAPWQNQGKGQSQWTFTVYGSESDAQNGTNPIDSFNQLGSDSPALPQTDLWIKETGMPAGHQFFGWYIPDGDNNSGNDKCNKQPLDGTSLTTTAILKIDKSYWSTKGNKTGLFHICAYNKPQQPQTISLTLRVCKLIKRGSADTNEQFTITVGDKKFTPNVKGAGYDDKKCKDYTYEVPNDSPTKSVTISETPPAGWDAPKYTTKNQTGSPSSEQDLPEGGLTLTIGQGTCFGQAGAAQASSNQNQTNPDCTVTIINNKPSDPAVQKVKKVKASEGYTGGYAYWDIKVKNPFESDWVFKIEDSGVQFVSVSNGTCSAPYDNDFSDDSIVCRAFAGKTMVVKVKRAVTPQCQPTTVNNSVAVKLLFPTWVDYGNAGNSNDTEYAIPGDPAKCDKPGITKTLVQNGSSQTTDPNAIAWLVTVTNPATGSNGTTQTVYIKDQNVTVVGTPVLSGGATCTPSSGSSFEADLNSANGVACSMPNSSSITFTVKPEQTPQRTCEGREFTNTAYLYVDSTTADPITAQGPAITLLGDPDLCERDITVCKVLKNNGDGIVKKSQLFTVYVKYDSQTTQVPLTVDEGGDQACGNVTVPANANVEVGETPARQVGWNGDADGYPDVTQDGDTYTVTNKEKPITVTVTFVKKICETFKDVPRNNGSNLNHIGAPYFQGLTENDLGTTEGNCKTVDWKFQIWSANTSNNPWPGNNPSGTKLQDATTGANVLNPAALTELITKGRLFITELYEPNYAFAALKCEGDMVNQDNWEWLYWSQVKDDGKITCTAYNVPATKQITIQKTFYGASQVSEADYPTFTISGGVDFDAACTGPTLSGTNPVTATWTCTVPYLWNGTVTETPAAGWEACEPLVAAQTVGDNQQEAPFSFTNCKKATIVVKKVVTNVDNDTTQFTVTLSGGQSSQTGQIAEAGPVNATFDNLPLNGSYTVTEQSQNGYQVLGWAYANNDGTCPEGPDAASANSKDKVTGMLLQPGKTRVICFYNELFGSVVVDKQAPSGAVPPGTPFNWTISVSVANGPTSSALTLTDTLPSGFTYGSITATSPLSCTLSSGTLSCTLPANTPIGTYTVTIPATAPTNTFAICGQHTNTVSFTGAGTNGTDSATVTIGCTASDGRILVKKVVRGQPGDATQFTAELTGPGITGTATQPFSQQNIGFFLGLAAGTFSVSEQPKAGYDYAGWAIGTIVGESVQCPANPTGTGSASVTLTNLAPQAAVCFYNQPRVTIRVHKTLNVIGFTSNGQGWQFTLTGCGITPQTKTTDANGIAEFTNLPPAIACSYTVTETTQAGWTPQFVSQTAQPTQGGQVVTLEFLNIRVFDPPCTDPNDPRCAPPPSSTPPTTTTTPPTGTATNTPTPTATPTNTPTPTPTNTPVTQVAGERTPGPGTSPTPLAPATGFGFGAGQGGMNLLLVLAGLVSLSLGLGFLALGRRRTDR